MNRLTNYTNEEATTFFFTGLNIDYCHCIEDEVVSLLLKVILLFLCEKMINIQHQNGRLQTSQN